MIAADGGISSIEMGRAPAGVAVDPTSHTAYVVNIADNSVSVVER